MSYTETFRLALRNIAGSKMRTFLTMLGIIIGITAVIVIVGMGNGMETYMREQFASLGANTLNVVVSGRGSARSASVDDMYELVRRNPDVLAQVSPTVNLSGSVKVGRETLRRTSVTGVSEDYFSMRGYEIAQGRGLQYMDVADRKDVCVVGSYVDETYYNGDAVGQTIRVGGNRLRIVGVMTQETEELSQGGNDDCLYLPYSTAARLNGKMGAAASGSAWASQTSAINNFTITVVDEDRSSEAKAAVENALFDIFGDSDAYSVVSMSEILDVMTSLIGIVITVLAVIAAISLVVGGIGIMNIMLVSVTERTREIGIRKALGAKEGVILRQFVMEAAVTAALGGVLGIILGYLLSSAATVILKAAMDAPLTVTPSPSSVALAFGVSAGIGILFGYLPARKAARLNPIDALRYE